MTDVCQQRARSREFIRVNRLKKVFGLGGSGELIALKDINCTIREGDFVSIVGPSGCGKSTLLRILAGLLSYSDGSVTMDDQAVRGTRRDVGVVFQNSILLPWRTILDNVMLPAEVLGLDIKAARHRAHELLAMVRLEGFEDRLPSELSGGMQQRASIARALLHDPRILLMDEPFGALDAMTRDDLNVELAQIWQDTRKTLLFITHSIVEAVFLSDRVVMMSKAPGMIVDTISIDLPRPRRLTIRDSAEFAAYVHRIRHHFAELGIVKE